MPIPFMRWRRGPGTSVMLTAKAPNDIAIPNGKRPKYANTKDGVIIPVVILRPSLKGRPFKKFLYVV